MKVGNNSIVINVKDQFITVGDSELRILTDRMDIKEPLSEREYYLVRSAVHAMVETRSIWVNASITDTTHAREFTFGVNSITTTANQYPKNTQISNTNE